MSLDSLTQNIDDAVSDFFDPVATAVGDVVFCTVSVGGADLPLIVAWLAIAGLVFTCWSGVVQARRFRLALDVVRGRYDEPDAPGEVSHFQALSAAFPPRWASATSPVSPSPSRSAVRAPPSG